MINLTYQHGAARSLCSWLYRVVPYGKPAGGFCFISCRCSIVWSIGARLCKLAIKANLYFATKVCGTKRQSSIIRSWTISAYVVRIHQNHEPHISVQFGHSENFTFLSVPWPNVHCHHDWHWTRLLRSSAPYVHLVVVLSARLLCDVSYFIKVILPDPGESFAQLEVFGKLLVGDIGGIVWNAQQLYRCVRLPKRLQARFASEASLLPACPQPCVEVGSHAFYCAAWQKENVWKFDVHKLWYWLIGDVRFRNFAGFYGSFDPSLSAREIA